MKDNYDIDRARSIVDDMLSAAYQGGRPEVQLLATAQFDQATVQTIQYPPSVRLLVNDPDGEPVDLALEVHGVLCGREFPPLDVKPIEGTAARIRSLRQQARITAFGSAKFEDAVNTLNTIRTMFERHIGDTGEIIGMDFLPYEGYSAIDTHARYFTDRNLIPYDKNTPFPKSVDPDGILGATRTPAFIRGPDNIVEYCEKVTTDNGEVKYKRIDPRKICIGDVVEVSFVCQAVPIKGKKYKLFLSLRSVAKVDDTVRRESEVATSTLGPPTIQAIQPSPSRIKRNRVDIMSEDETDSGSEKKRFRFSNGADDGPRLVQTANEGGGEEVTGRQTVESGSLLSITGGWGDDAEMEEGEVPAKEMDGLRLD